MRDPVALWDSEPTPAPASRYPLEPPGRAQGFDFERELTEDLPHTFRRLRELRDQNGDLKVALGASNALFDRQAPKRSADDGARHFHLHLSGADLREMRSVVGEVLPQRKAIDVTPVRTQNDEPVGPSTE